MNFNYRPVLSGLRQDPLALGMRFFLRLAEFPYGLVVRRRNQDFDAGRNVSRVDVPVISVGNLTTGGTGKTPVVCYLAKWFRRHGVRVAIVSRGYGRGERDENDEALELHARLPDVPHVQDPDRVAGATLAIDEFESQLILLDDGFQHRRLHRDLDIVLIDATCPFGFGHLLPRGLLREPTSSLTRAGLVIVTRVSGASAEQVEEIERVVRQYQTKCRIVLSDHQPSRLLEHPDTEISLEELAGKRVAAVSGIGNPTAFADSITQCGAVVVASKQLPDHDAYSPTTVAALRAWIVSLGDTIDLVICTHKDLVKLETDRLGGRPLRALVIDLVIRRGEEDLDQCLVDFRATVVDDDQDELD